MRNSCGKAKFSRRLVLETDCVICSVVFHMRAKAFKKIKMRVRGFETWKLATTIVRQHRLNALHKEAVERVITLIAETTDVGVATSCSEFFCYQ